MERSTRSTPHADNRSVVTQRLLASAATADPDSRRNLQQQVLALNTALAVGQARRYRGRGVEDQDLDQVALMGLWKAVLGYREGSGSTFAAFAVPTIRGELRRHFRDHAWLVRPTRIVQEQSAAVAQATEELRNRLGREPSRDDVTAHLGLTRAEVERARAARQGYAGTSLDQAPYGSTRTWTDTLGKPDPGMERTDWSITLRAVIADLPTRQQQLVRLRYVDELSQVEIGRRLGISQMQVSRLLRRLITDLHAALRPLHAA